ncbi:MAG: lytic transglycosylase domain-containing protein [Burkholderiales bacterium]
MNSRFRFCLAAGACVWLFTAGSARAEIVLLTSGRTLAAKSHRLEGDTIILQMRNGGEVTCDRSLIEKIVDDEVPYQEPQAVVVAAEAPAAAPIFRTIPSVPYGEIITSLSRAHGVDPVLVSALIQIESNYHPRARSNKGAMGLMQLMPSTARQYNVRNPYDPTANIAAGVKHLKSLIDRFGVELALAAYNAGEGAVKKFNGIPPYSETRSYVSRILALARPR